MNHIRSAFAALGLSLICAPAFAGDVRIMWYSDGVEGDVLRDVLSRFQKENPGINVILDEVAFRTVQEQLPIQLESGTGPDIVRVVNLKAQARHWLDLTPYLADPEYWRTNFGAQADWMREDGGSAIPGFMTQITLAGGFVNLTLFEQAEVEPPGAGASWDDWVAAAAKVAESQGSVAAFGLDRSGHRIAGPMISYGAKFIDDQGGALPVNAGLREFAGKLIGWVEGGQMLKDTWVAASGSSYRAAADDFINAAIPFYYSGNWQIPNFAQKIGDGFDWTAAPSPCGPEACAGMPGGAGLVAVKYTKNPEEVAKVMEFLAQEEILREMSERTLFLPAHAGVIAKGGLDWKTEDPNVKAALDVFVQAVGELNPDAARLQAWKWGTAYYGAMVNRISQAMAGEIGLDEAMQRIDADVTAQIAAAQ